MPAPSPDSRNLSAFVPAGFFALRTPLMPFERLVGLTQAESDHGRVQLRRWVEEPRVREALFIASPSLDESISLWLTEPDSERGRKVERTLVRYFARMAGRATPFGLFATHAVGRIDEQTRLTFGADAQLRKHTRLDMDYVCSLVEHLHRTPEVRGALRYVPNSSILRTATRLRYLEARQYGRGRSYHLVAMETTACLEQTLERARPGATLAQLARALVEQDADIPLDDAQRYAEALVEAQLLVPTWAPPVTGPEPVPYLITQAQDVPALSAVRERLAQVQARLGEMSAVPGTPPESYRALARSLESLPVPVALPRLFQVDAVRSAPDLALSQRVTEEILHGVEALRRLTPRAEPVDALAHFRERFAERYEHRAVPLLEALDEERGIGLRLDARLGSSTSPLIQGLALQARSGRTSSRLDKSRKELLRRLEACWRAQAHELVLTPGDLDALAQEETARLPDAFGVMGTLVARSVEAVDRGDFRFVLEHVHGPSGATMLGRFCHGEPALEAQVREHLRAEERLRPEAVFAEIAHLPQDRVGNVICRPELRRHDIVFLGQSGLPRENQIRVDDLWLSLENGRLVLRSRQLGKEIIPRLTNAHAFSVYGVGLYRFLGLLQNQDQQGLSFGWGALGAADFLPRVSYGRTVLSRARWNLKRPRLQEWSRAGEAERLVSFQAFREQARLPRWVCLKDGDNELPLDLDNALCLRTLFQALKKQERATLEELYPGPEELCVEGQEGRYVNEFVVPFIRQQPPSTPSREPRPAAPVCTAPRRFPPGSEWLYLKLYTGTASAERLLREVLPRTLQQLTAAGVADRWFFLRYKDPEHHLRVRLQGVPERLEAEAWPALRKACAAVLDEGDVWRIQLDTYEREVERYGGPEGILLAEQFFAADSAAVLELLQACGGPTGAELRWQLALKGMDALLEDLGFEVKTRLQVVRQLKESFAHEFSGGQRFQERLGLRFRAERKPLEALLLAEPTSPGPLQPWLAAFQRRSAWVRPLGQQLWRAREEGQLSVTVEELASSLLHMHANRMFPEEQRAQEFILYDFLERLYRSRLARGPAT